MLWLVDTAVAVFIVNIDAADDAPTAALFFPNKYQMTRCQKKLCTDHLSEFLNRPNPRNNKSRWSWLVLYWMA